MQQEQQQQQQGEGSFNGYATCNEWVFNHPSFIMLCGASFSGKSSWILKLLKERDRLIQPNVQRVIFVYGQDLGEYFHRIQSLVPNVEFIHGLKSAEETLDLNPQLNNLLIFEDLFLEALQSSWFCNLVSRIAHHTNTTVLFTTQNMYQQTPMSKTISNQAKYIVLFKNVRDVNQVKYLGQQVLGSGGGKILDYIVLDVTKDNKFGYVILDMHPLGDDKVRILTSIFSDESNCPLVYEVEDEK